MKVFNLRCSLGHDFEGWFGSEADFSDQIRRGLLGCPLCGDVSVQKMPSAPRLNLRAGATPPASSTPVAEASDKTVDAVAGPQVQAQFLQAVRQLMARTDDVGEQFAEQARAMHHGEIERRNIRGKASVQEAVSLLEDGVDILPLPDLPALKNTLQ